MKFCALRVTIHQTIPIISQTCFRIIINVETPYILHNPYPVITPSKQLYSERVKQKLRINFACFWCRLQLLIL